MPTMVNASLIVKSQALSIQGLFPLHGLDKLCPRLGSSSFLVLQDSSAVYIIQALFFLAWVVCL